MSQLEYALREVARRPHLYIEQDGTYKIDIPDCLLSIHDIEAWGAEFKQSSDGYDWTLTLTPDDLVGVYP